MRVADVIVIRWIGGKTDLDRESRLPDRSADQEISATPRPANLAIEILIRTVSSPVLYLADSVA